MNKRQMDFTPVKRKAVGNTGAASSTVAVNRTVGGVSAVNGTTTVKRKDTGRIIVADRGTTRSSRSAVATPKPITARQSTRGGSRATMRGATGYIHSAKAAGAGVVKRTATSGVAVAKSGAGVERRSSRPEGEFKISGRRLGEIEDLNPRFVRTDVPKRPLSKNVYQKVVVPAKEPVTKKPKTIIEKPKKESHVGVVVTIILTIILGAVAGTVAFLLLPK